MIDDVQRIYRDGKLLIRAMDQPVRRKMNDIGYYYECDSWINEFVSLMNEGLFSLSTTLIVPNVGVRTYKNIGYLVDSSFADCFHIAKEDSGSCGNCKDGDFHANKPDFDSIDEMGEFIRRTNATNMNEVNINVKLNGIVGLFINKCLNSQKLLKKIYVAKTIIKHLTGIDYPIYLYDLDNGKLEQINMTKEEEQMLIDSLDANQIICWPDNYPKEYYVPIINSQKTR